MQNWITINHMSSDNISPKGYTWDEVEKELFTLEEIAASDLRVATMIELTCVIKKNRDIK